MLKFVCVLFILVLYKYCHGTQTGEWKQHFYQPRRNYSDRIKNESAYQPKASENLQSQVSFTLLKPRKERHINQSTEMNIGVQHSLTQWTSTDGQNESNSRRRLFRDSFKINTLKPNEIGLKNDQDSLRAKIYFTPRNNRNSQLRNSVRAATKQTAKQNGNFQTEHQDSQIFSDCCSVTSNALFVRNTGSKSVSNGHNSFKGPDYLPPLDKTTIMYKAPEYLPPTERPYYPIKKITNHPTKTPTNNFSTQAITTKKPLIPIKNQRPATNQPYCKTCISTSGPLYIPVTQSTLPSVFETNTYKGKEYDPAKVMQVPAEEEEGMVNIIPLPPKNDQADKGIPSEEGVELKANIPRNVTTVVKERGDVPGKEESTSVEPTIVIPVASNDQSTRTLTTDVPSTLQMIYTSKIAMTTGIPSEEGVELKANMPNNVTTTFRPFDRVNERGDVPGKEESASIEPMIFIPVASNDQSTLTTDVPSTLQMIYSKIATTTPKVRLMSTDPSITSNKKIPMQTFENDRHLIEESGPTTQTNMRNTAPFKGLEYLPPDITKKTTLIPTTPQSLEPAPVMAMPVSPELEVVPPIPPPTTTTFMTPENRYQTEANLPTNTSFSGPEYLPPKDQRIPTATAPSGAAPALAMPVPPEPEDITIPTSSSPKTSTDAFRAAKSPNTPTDTNFKAPEYLPPKKVIPALPPSPAMAIPVPKEPDCENDPNNTPNIDPRFADTDPCGNKKSTKSFKGPPYLPPLAKTII